MSEESLINVTPVDTRVALVENGMLQEAYIERTSRKGIVVHLQGQSGGAARYGSRVRGYRA